MELIKAVSRISKPMDNSMPRLTRTRTKLILRGVGARQHSSVIIRIETNGMTGN